MAIATLRFRMPTFQNVSGLAMIEVGFALLPTYQRKLHAVMVAVTRCAKFRLFRCAFGGRRGKARMKTAIALQALCDGSMALQTFRVARLLAHFMAGETVGQTFELRVHTG